LIVQSWNPDEFDAQSIEDDNGVSDLLDELANGLGIEWQGGDALGIAPYYLTAEEDEIDEDDLDNYLAVTVTAEMLINAKKEAHSLSEGNTVEPLRRKVEEVPNV
jgi:hypothetical protein